MAVLAVIGPLGVEVIEAIDHPLASPGLSRMSSVYAQEPASTGKVLFHTTYGEIEVELWCKEAPMASRNFIQLALEGYYDACPFHRLLPRFILQAGDTFGDGGQSIYGAPFPPESHSRLSFGRRGILGMAAVTPDGLLTSQFFFTLDRAPELDGKNTVFGRVIGDTVYNLLRIGELEVDKETERPLFPPLINRIEVLLNPFADIIPRELPQVQERLLRTRQKAEAASKPRPTVLAVKNKTLLSFADEDDEGEMGEYKMISSHDVLNDPKLSKQKLDITQPEPEQKKPEPIAKAAPASEYDRLKAERASELSNIEASIAALQKDLRRTAAGDHQQAEVKDTGKKSKRTHSLLEEQRAAYKSKPHAIIGKRKKDQVDDVNTLLTLNAFKEKLQSIDESGRMDPTRLATADAPELAKVLDICRLHGLVNCLSCRDTFGRQEEAGGDEGWLMHRLVFDKEHGYRELREDLDSLVVIDPREKSKEILGNGRK